jgi:hypothetical protein
LLTVGAGAGADTVLDPQVIADATDVTSSEEAKKKAEFWLKKYLSTQTKKDLGETNLDGLIAIYRNSKATTDPRRRATADCTTAGPSR